MLNIKLADKKASDHMEGHANKEQHKENKEEAQYLQELFAFYL